MKLAEYLARRHLSYAQFTAMTGLSKGTVSLLVRGLVNPSLATAQIISDATGGWVTANDFMKRPPPPRRRIRLPAQDGAP